MMATEPTRPHVKAYFKDHKTVSRIDDDNLCIMFKKKMGWYSTEDSTMSIQMWDGG